MRLVARNQRYLSEFFCPACFLRWTSGAPGGSALGVATRLAVGTTKDTKRREQTVEWHVPESSQGVRLFARHASHSVELLDVPPKTKPCSLGMPIRLVIKR